MSNVINLLFHKLALYFPMVLSQYLFLNIKKETKSLLACRNLLQFCHMAAEQSHF